MKLRGRPEAPLERRGRTLSSGARGAQPQAHHGPLERLLEVMSSSTPCDKDPNIDGGTALRIAKGIVAQRERAAAAA